MPISLRRLTTSLIFLAGFSPLIAAEDLAWKVLYPASHERVFSLETKRTDPFPEVPERLEIRSKDESAKMILLSRVPEASIINSGNPYTVVFKTRMDSVEPSGEPFALTLSCQQEGGAQGPTSSIWFVTVQNGKWCVVGTREGKNGVYWQGLPLKAETGIVYTIRIQVSPKAGTFQAEISSDAGQAESPEMGFAVKEFSSGVNKEILFRVTSAKSTQFTASLAGPEITWKE